MSIKTRIAALGAAALSLTGCDLQASTLFLSFFGPPTPSLEEVYVGTGSGGTFDHSALDGLLSRHVHGFSVDYAGMVSEQETLDSYISAIGEAPFETLDRDRKLALLINAYNAFTIKLILDHRPIASIKDISGAERWDAERWTIAGQTYSLTSLEHQEIRAKFLEPRVHFAINCASVGCPPLRAEAYAGDRLEEQLADQTRVMHGDERWLRIEGRTVHLTPLYLWYRSDFEQVSGTSLDFAAQSRPELATGDWTIRWMDYDWSLNSTE
ncbi:MAG: hypothetical protein ACJAZO_000461 [Myxococcota bacterium]|jgi:hypothetical protein